ncbi:MAG: hypothetical protein R3275_06335 [Saprospiraceae bacterium]|nr:hypothetical protein [Saprospiraceae bacterium]
MSLIFDGIENPGIRSAFEHVFQRYEILRNSKIYVRKRHLKGMTMRALPKLDNLLFPPIRSYEIHVAEHVRDSNKKRVDELERDVLMGWVAHEMGHLADYHRRKTLSMLWYGLKYYLFSSFARDVEHEADRLAVQHGFIKEILATKEFLFFSPEISAGYRKKLRNLYMSIEEVKLCVPENQSII